ncbi:MAG TPA: hypothetical protein V6D18_11715 [Thermosynechococcaceae cyanobacterium]
MSDSLLTKSSVVFHTIVITTTLAIISGHISPRSLPSVPFQSQFQVGR